MVVKSRRSGARNWARGVFAFFWIVLAGFSGLYLFTLFTDPAALGGQIIQLSAITGDQAEAGAAGSAPASEDTSAISAAEVAELRTSLEALSKKLTEINGRLKPIEEFVGPVAALPPAASVTTSMPEPMPPAPEAPSAAARPAAEEPAEEVAVTETTAPEPPAPPAPVVVAAPEPVPAPAPVAQTAAPVPEPAAAEPPSVVAAPMEDEPAPEPEASAPETADEIPAPAPEAEIASLDPVTLPPAANDGSTRYGIEIGSVSKRDELRPLWREFLTNHAALVAGLQPRRVLAPDKKWRLIAGPFADAQDAEGACTLFKKADRPCAATVYAGDAL